MFSQIRFWMQHLFKISRFIFFFLYLAFFQGLTGPLGLKGDEGPTGPPGDPAKGVRISSRIFGETVTRGYHNSTFISLKQIIGPTGKKGARVSSPRLNTPLDGRALNLQSPPLP